jgi:abortive phage resistance protein AbiGi (putative antitoxin)
MTSIQRYVSKELAHFAGRGKPEADQYDTLLKILDSGALIAPSGVRPRRPDGSPQPAGHEWLYDSIDLTGEYFRTPAVCFCDIPVEDLDVHTGKYSRFGLSFLKEFVVPRGASPVFYLDRAAAVEPSLYSLDQKAAPREKIFEVGLGLVSDLLYDLEHGRRDASGGRSAPWATNTEDRRRLYDVETFFVFHVLSFLKPFDALTTDADPENYYMEREWRVLRRLEFDIDDVYRIFLPREYARRFREDLPDYAGQLTFV